MVTPRGMKQLDCTCGSQAGGEWPTHSCHNSVAHSSRFVPCYELVSGTHVRAGWKPTPSVARPLIGKIPPMNGAWSVRVRYCHALRLHRYRKRDPPLHHLQLLPTACPYLAAPAANNLVHATLEQTRLPSQATRALLRPAAFVLMVANREDYRWSSFRHEERRFSGLVAQRDLLVRRLQASTVLGRANHAPAAKAPMTKIDTALSVHRMPCVCQDFPVASVTTPGAIGETGLQGYLRHTRRRPRSDTAGRSTTGETLSAGSSGYRWQRPGKTTRR